MKKPIFIMLAAFIGATSVLARAASEPSGWESNTHITGLPKIELGQWEVPDTVGNKWADKNGDTDRHNYPSCFLLNLEEGTDVTTGKSYVLKDIAGLFGPEGLLQDNRDNLDRLMESPLMTGTRIIYEATGGPVDVDFMFGSGGFGNRLCYFYIVPSSPSDEQKTVDMAQSLANGEIPTFCITDQMRTSIHMERYKKNADGEWEKLPKGSGEGEYEFGNRDLGDKLADVNNNYGGWGDDLITGKRFRLKYFGEQYNEAPSNDFPKGTKIYFFLATYDDFNWNGGSGEGQKTPYSIKFAYRAFNREFGTQGKWDFEHYPEHKEKYDTYGPGIFAAAAVNFTYTDSDKGTLENINFMTWEDWTQPTPDNAVRKVGDFDMGDVGFGLYGVNNPILDVISESRINLQVVQEVKDFQEVFDNPATKGAWRNAYRYKFTLKNGDENGKNMVYSRALQPVTFTQTDATTGEGRFNPSYTWASIRRFSDDSEIGEVVKYVVFRKTARLPDNSSPKVEDLNNPNLVYRIEYAMTGSYDENSIPAEWNGVWNLDSGSQTYFEHRRGTENDRTALPLEKMTSLYHDATETLNSENKYINKKKFRMMFAFRDGMLVRTNEDAVASPRADLVIEPRGTAGNIDLFDKDTRHLKSLEDLAPIDNRTYFTITYNPLTNLFKKEHISALFIVNEEGKRFCKIIHKEETGEWETLAESTDEADNQNRLYEIMDVIDESDTRRHIVIATNLVPEKDFAVMVETKRDVYPAGLSIIHFNTFGAYPAKCKMPSLDFYKASAGQLGKRALNGESASQFVYNVDTGWSLHGADDLASVTFSQWRSYNNQVNLWRDVDNPEGAYLNILYDNTAMSGTIPGDDYLRWLGESFSDSSNQLIYNSDGKWSNHDILAQHYDGVSDVYADYVLRAYLPSVPAVLAGKEPRAFKASDTAPVDGYVVLESRNNATSTQSVVPTGVENVIPESNEAVRYYNFQGCSVACPVAGRPYIVKRGGKVSKEIFR